MHLNVHATLGLNKGIARVLLSLVIITVLWGFCNFMSNFFLTSPLTPLLPPLHPRASVSSLLVSLTLSPLIIPSSYFSLPSFLLLPFLTSSEIRRRATILEHPLSRVHTYRDKACFRSFFLDVRLPSFPSLSGCFFKGLRSLDSLFFSSLFPSRNHPALVGLSFL